jgi:hypothetical protein
MSYPNFTINSSSIYQRSKVLLPIFTKHQRSTIKVPNTHAEIFTLYTKLYFTSICKYIPTTPHLATIIMCHVWYYRCPLCGATDDRLEPVYGQNCSFRGLNTRDLDWEHWISPIDYCGNDEFRAWLDAPRKCKQCLSWEFDQMIERMEHDEELRRLWEGSRW